MKPRPFWEAVQEHVTDNKRSCLACHELKLRNYYFARCDAHPQLEEGTSRPHLDFVGRALKRAKKCQEFDGEA